MGDGADLLFDQMVEARIACYENRCGPGCQWCTRCRKRCYADKKEALTHKNVLIANHAKHWKMPKDLRAYRCPECKAWHLSSKPVKGKEPNEGHRDAGRHRRGGKGKRSAVPCGKGTEEEAALEL